MPPVDLLLAGISQLATPRGTGALRGHAMRDIEIISDAVIGINDGRIAWVGPRSDWSGKANRLMHFDGRAVIPALVDPHTHAIWAGDRLADFEARVSGVSYETILAGGGGIRSTIRHTAGASAAELMMLAKPRIEALTRNGAATIEIKSGYGFTVEAELTSLEAIAMLRPLSAARLISTLLIHIPPKDTAERGEYLAQVCQTLIPEVARRGLAAAVDIFIERESFSVPEARAVFDAAKANGLPVKAHVDQFHAIGGLELALQYGALSADHLEASGPPQIQALAVSTTIATVLPGVTLHLGLPAAPGRALIDAGAAVAIGTDLNPGSSPLFSTQLALALAVRLNGLTPAEALSAGTVNAAAALGLNDTGRIAIGYRADLLVLSSPNWLDMVYQMGESPVAHIFIAGVEVPS